MDLVPILEELVGLWFIFCIPIVLLAKPISVQILIHEVLASIRKFYYHVKRQFFEQV